MVMEPNWNPPGGHAQNSAFENTNRHENGLKLAEEGRYQEALTCMQEHLRTAPDDAESLNDTGAILHCLGRSNEAIDHFIRAYELRNDSAEIIWNLAEAYIATGRANEAIQLFDKMQQLGVLNVDVLNRTASILLDQNNKADAVEILLRSLQICPEQEILEPMIQVIRSKRPKVAFFCGLTGDTKFLSDIYEFTERRFNVRFFEGQDVNQMYELMKWSDISWFEWCTNMAVEASRLPKVCRNIVRLHRFEAYGDWPGHVQWENIDSLITIGNSFVEDALLKRVLDIRSRTQLVTIPNGVNLDRFKFTDRSRGRNIASVGYLNMRKNPMFLLQCMQKLHYINPEYKLFFAGNFQDSMLEQYIKHIVRQLKLTDVVFFDGWQEDMNAWLMDKHYIVSASIGESQGMGLLEAMACGLKPVIHNFPGANQIFPSEFLFNISEEFCGQIISGTYEPQKYRELVETNYSLKDQLSKINKIFTRLEAEIDAEQSGIPLYDSRRNLSPQIDRLSPEVHSQTFGNNRIM
jgi:glycosyltransferase involved in cell wall biosynthesis